MKKFTEHTIDYYNQNAEGFIANTASVDFTETQERFLAKLKNGAKVLDYGCGSGRDTKYFLEWGCQVTAIDGSVELCKRASEYTGIRVKQMLFLELDESDAYDGIWACSSILHLPEKELGEAFSRMAKALKRDGILYTSFKYGTYEGDRGGRFFTDMTENKFMDFLKPVYGLIIEEQWVTADVRPGRGDEKWLNIILRKR